MSETPPEEVTALDRAHAEMQAAPEDGAARLRFYERLADSELFVMLSKEADGDRISPELFETPDGRFVLVFDREERLAQFASDAVPYAGLAGRGVVEMLAGQGIGLGVNLEVAPSSTLLGAEAINWLHETLQNAPDRVEAEIEELLPPSGLPEVLLTALDAKLATAAGLAAAAYLVSLRYAGGGQGHLLGFVAAKPEAEAALAQAVSEALTFSGIEAGALDVGFFATSDQMAAGLERVGLRFDLPVMEAPKLYQPKIPGGDPDAPPILK
ncbi:SseB family protein [Pseudophaeobacter sp. EL27]|uniref:SseB family protein n=1 Tax=Pseudophaeobacter sp. EL27 TaxID=2107580 RepID=UPI000EFBE2D8|nr:SseB family protein [Pseudophaeobacter sp. EL27]